MRKKKSSKKTKAKTRKARGGAKIRKQAKRRKPVVERRVSASDSGKQSGDFQGLHNAESADSESVDELLEEGNTFEAGVVAGVEEADDEEGRSVHTREVLEDDVPEEYDKD